MNNSNYANFSPIEQRRSSSHTEEELKTLTLDENLGEIKRAAFIIQKGQQMQKYAIYSNIQSYVKYPQFSSLLFPLIREDLYSQDDEILIIGIKQLTLICKLLNEKDQHSLLQTACLFIKTWKDREEKDYLAWTSIFQELSNIDVVLCKQLITELSDQFMSPQRRQFSAKLMEYCPIIELLQILCMDTDMFVRFQSIKTIQLVYKQFTPEILSSYLLPKIHELLYDNEPPVRMAAIEMFFTIQSQLKEREKWIAKYFFEFLNSTNVQIITVMSRICGRTLLELQDVQPNIAKFMKIYYSFAESQHEEIRLNFAYNFPGILQILHGDYFDNFKDTYIDSILFDNHMEVRKCLMASLPVVIKVITHSRAQSLVPTICKLLNEDIVQLNLSEIVENLWIGGEFEDTQLSKDMVNEILKEIVKLLCGKKPLIVLQQLLKIHDYLSQCDVYECLATPLISMMSNESHQIRMLAMQNLASVAYVEQHLNPKIVNLCYESTKFRMRINYIEFISSTINLCSKKYFQNMKLIRVLNLSQDPIKDVRIKLANIIKKIDSIIAEDDDVALTLYNSACKHLQRDKITADILRQYDPQNINMIDDMQKEQREYVSMVRHSVADLDQEMPQQFNSLRKVRQAVSRQPQARGANSLKNIVKEILPKKSSVPPPLIKKPNNQPPITNYKSTLSFKPKLGQLAQQQRLKK